MSNEQYIMIFNNIVIGITIIAIIYITINTIINKNK